MYSPTLERAINGWTPLADTLVAPHTEAAYQRLVAILDELIDTVGEDEEHPLAGLMETVGVLVKNYEDRHVPETSDNNMPINLLHFLNKLEAHAIPYTLTRVREEALMINIAVPGERWEVEFLCDGGVEIERFRSSGDIEDETSLGELFARYTEVAPIPVLAITI